MNEKLKEAVTEAIREAMGGALDCGRAWSAWGVGTMSEDDFSLVADDSERVEEIADAVLGALSAQPDVGTGGDAREVACPKCKGHGGERWHEADGSERGERCDLCDGFGHVSSKPHSAEDVLPGDLRWKLDNLRLSSSGTAALSREEWDYVRAALAARQPVGELVPYIVGNQYRTQAGELVRFVSVHNEGTSYECMEDESGVNRYTRRDFGRVTGSPHDYSDPRNTPPLYAAPPAPAAVPVDILGQLADALDCFWNPAVGAVQQASYHGPASGSDVVGAIAQGLAAVAERLRAVHTQPEAAGGDA